MVKACVLWMFGDEWQAGGYIHYALETITIQLGTLASVWSVATTKHCGINTIHCGINTIHCGINTIHCGINTIHCGINTIHCAMNKTLWNEYNTLWY